VLLHDVTGDGEEIGLRASDLIVIPDSHEPQEDLLSKVGDMSGIRKIQLEETTQAAAVFCGDFCNEGASVYWAQVTSEGFLTMK